MTTLNLVTREDLELFKKEFLEDLKQLITKSMSDKTQKDWLRSSEVREKLNISPAILHNLRKNGTLTYSKIGSIYYHKMEDVLKMLVSRPLKS